MDGRVLPPVDRDSMRVYFQYTVADFRALYRSFPLKQRLEWVLLLPLWLLLISLPGTLLLAALGDYRSLAVGWLFVMLFLAWVFVSYFRALRTIDPKALLPASVWIEEPLVGAESALGWSRRDWSLIREVRELPEHILLFTGFAEAFAVPRRAFASAAEAEQFSNLTRRCFARSRESGYIPFAPPLPAEISQSEAAAIPTALRITYRNTAEDLATLQVRGLVKQVSRSSRLANWLWIAVFAALIGFFISLRRYEPWAGEFGSLLAFAGLFFIGLQSFNTVQCWRCKKQIEPHRLLPVTLTITPSGMSGYASLGEHGHDWSAIDEIAENERFVVFYISRPRFLAAVPKSAFENPAEAERFVYFARQWKELSVSAPAPSQAPLVVSDNPYQSPAESG